MSRQSLSSHLRAAKSNRFDPRRAAWLFAFVLGCESFAGFGTSAGGGAGDDAAAHRARYVGEGDPRALRWLLANRIDSGMTIEEVNAELGEDGERIFEDGWLKNGEGQYRQDDEAWKWGPDRDGNAIYLLFREDRLALFDPEDYR